MGGYGFGHYSIEFIGDSIRAWALAEREIHAGVQHFVIGDRLAPHFAAVLGSTRLPTAEGVERQPTPVAAEHTTRHPRARPTTSTRRVYSAHATHEAGSRLRGGCAASRVLASPHSRG